MISSETFQKIEKIARLAGAAILEVYGTDDFQISNKEDDSPLTEADRRSHSVIIEGLTSITPEIPVISEESAVPDYNERKDWPVYWLIDPLDGTKEFIKRNGEFTVNIALIEKSKPTGGVVYQPVTNTLYSRRPGESSFKINAQGHEETLSPSPHYRELNSVRVVASRSHMSEAVTDFIQELEDAGKTTELHSAGSSLKICLVAEGAADVYPRLGPTMEWDTAAAHAIATGAGRKINHYPEGSPLEYNKKDLLNPWFIVE